MFKINHMDIQENNNISKEDGFVRYMSSRIEKYVLCLSTKFSEDMEHLSRYLFTKNPEQNIHNYYVFSNSNL